MRSEEPIIVVSGLPRSGTSMMMRMLQVGGIEILSDHIRAADKHNPKGYFELERVKSLHKHHDKSWLEAAQGKAIKVVSELLKALPESYSYRMVFMNRDLREIVDSQNKMLATSNAHSVEKDQVLPPFRRHLEKIKQWLVGQPHFRVLDVDYHDVLQAPIAQSERIQTFVEKELDVKKMASEVDPELYRSRA